MCNDVCSARLDYSKLLTLMRVVLHLHYQNWVSNFLIKYIAFIYFFHVFPFIHTCLCVYIDLFLFFSFFFSCMMLNNCCDVTWILSHEGFGFLSISKDLVFLFHYGFGISQRFIKRRGSLGSLLKTRQDIESVSKTLVSEIG